jgi:hypothetical protein
MAVMVVLVVAVRGELNRRQDDRLYDRMVTDPTLDSIPPRSEMVERTGAGPCEGDSATGPAVVTALSSELPTEDVLGFYRERLDELGWTDVSEQTDSLVGTRTDGGYRLEFSVSADSFEGIDYWVVLRADPRQNCLLPIL